MAWYLVSLGHFSCCSSKNLFHCHVFAFLVCQGYIVQATAKVRARTLICEYAGGTEWQFSFITRLRSHTLLTSSPQLCAPSNVFCEISEVDFTRHHIFSNSSQDDFMDLLRSTHSKTRYAIWILLTFYPHEIKSTTTTLFFLSYIPIKRYRFVLSLVIIPSHRSNLARFLSGINNHQGAAGKKKVCRTVLRFVLAFPFWREAV